jgi:hypothetical protein
MATGQGAQDEGDRDQEDSEAVKTLQEHVEKVS